MTFFNFYEMKKILLLFTALSLLFSCAKEKDIAEGQGTPDTVVKESSAYKKGEVIIEFDDNMVELIENSPGNPRVLTKSAGLNSALDELGISTIERLFPDAGEFEPRTRAEGLHKFYKVKFSEEAPLTKAVTVLEELPGVVNVERKRKIRPRGFDDPKLKDQWHYFNDGTGGSLSGADINVKPVWENYTTGKSDVIVAVVDAGIDLKHEDLKDNVIPGGQDGSKNFVKGNFTIVAGDHGTHVAGTIGAVNNNGKGVCGIAGGDKKANVAGVKMLSCQIFQYNPVTGEDEDGDESAAIKWGADHGAVISQNSWGYSPDDSNNNGIIDNDELEAYKKMKIPSSLKAAIDYFIKYAGCDNKGDQLPNSPMKGGVVIFAAGNDNINYDPVGDYDQVIAVGSINRTGNKSSFSNYGDWVDICAPGSNVLSTIPGNAYGLMSGTSMACPHVSGVAALIVSQFGGNGFTVAALKDKLLEGAKAGVVPEGAKIGKLVDALGSMTYGGEFVPEKVTEFSCSAVSNNIDFEWKVTQSATGNKKAYGFMLMASKNKPALEAADPKHLSDEIKYLYVVTPEDVAAGATMTARLEGLDFESEYFVAIAASDYASTYSDFSEIKNLNTSVNNAPELTLAESDVIIRAFEVKKVLLNINEPDGHKFSVKIEGEAPAVKLEKGFSENEYYAVITGKDAEAGKYSANIKVEDPYGLSVSKTLKYEVLENQTPVKNKDFNNIITDEIGKRFVFDANEYIVDPDGETLKFSFEISNQDVVHINPAGSVLHATTLGYGLSEVKVKAEDVLGKSVSSSFRVLVRDKNVNLEAYPNPVREKLNVRASSEEVETEIKLVSSTGAVVFYKKEVFGAFSPLVINMEALAPGTYMLYASYGGKTYKRSVIKI